MVKLFEISAVRAAWVVGLVWCAPFAIACAQGEDLSSPQKDAGRQSGSGGFVGSGGTSSGSGQGGGFLGSGGGSGSTGGSVLGSGGSSSGSGGSGGSSGSFTGAGGQAGAFLGRGGAMPSDGAAGAGGGTVYDGPVSMGLEALYMAGNNGLAFTVKILNNGLDSPLLSALKVRYYFVDDLGVEFGGEVKFDSAAWNSGMNMPPYYQPLTCTSSFVKYGPRTGADTYVEMGCTAPTDMTLGPFDTETIQVRVQFASGATEDPTNDYSYMATTGTDPQINPKIIVLQSGVIVWGTEPPP